MHKFIIRKFAKGLRYVGSMQSLSLFILLDSQHAEMRSPLSYSALACQNRPSHSIDLMSKGYLYAF